MKKKYTLVLLALLTLQMAKANEPTKKQEVNPTETPHQVSLNLLGFALKNIQLNYDYNLQPNQSVGGSLNFLLPRGDFFSSSVDPNSSINFSNGNFYGYGINAHYKYFPYGEKNGGPQSFYIGALIRHQKLNYDLDVTATTSTFTGEFQLDMGLSSFAVGGLIGVQLRTPSHVFFDLGIYPRLNYNTFKASADITLESDDLDKLEETLKEYFDFDVFGSLENRFFNFTEPTIRFGFPMAAVGVG
ncbi:MAG: hypothetical protein KDC92_17830, partial [Bacteroidetes bacterium]|nr:hypothetical protein [Bacteroidota bacterium]